jgi:hypothetical protein
VLSGVADFDKEHMPTLDQVNEVMDGLTMLDAHLQVRAGFRRVHAGRLAVLG